MNSFDHLLEVEKTPEEKPKNSFDHLIEKAKTGVGEYIEGVKERQKTQTETIEKVRQAPDYKPLSTPLGKESFAQMPEWYKKAAPIADIAGLGFIGVMGLASLRSFPSVDRFAREVGRMATKRKITTTISPEKVLQVYRSVHPERIPALEKLSKGELANVVKNAMKGEAFKATSFVPRFGRAPLPTPAPAPTAIPTKAGPLDVIRGAPETIAQKPPDPVTAIVTDLALKESGETIKDFSTYERTIQTFNEAKKNIVSSIDIEYPFRKAGAPETGLAIKNMAAKMDAGEDYSLKMVKDINKMNLTKDEASNLAFMVEGTEPVTPNAAPAVELLKGELDRDLELLKTQSPVAALKTGFPEGMIADKTAVLKDLQGKTKNAETTAAISKVEEELEILQNISYMPIQSKILFDDIIKEGSPRGKVIGPKLGEGAFASFKKLKGRTSLSLKQLVDKGIISKDKVDARRLVASYKRYIYNKLAELDVVNSGIKEGLIVPVSSNPPANFVDVPTKLIPELKGYKVDPVFADYFATTLGELHRKGGISRVLSIVKMWQFYNPLFLPLNDVIQAAMLGSFANIKMPAYTAKAIRMMATKPPEYFEALKEGIASTPFKNPWQVYEKSLNKLTQTNSLEHKLFRNLQRYAKTLGMDAIGDLYSLSWNVAWTLDRTVRFMSYNYLKDKGFSTKDAAQITASFHGDYSSIPAKTRRRLNTVLFTPTFKIAMGKLYSRMLTGAARATRPGQTLNDKQYATGILKTLAVILGTKFALEKLGFKEQEFGRKYTLDVETSKGPKAITMSFATPANIPMRYYYRFIKPRPEDLNIPSRFWNGIKMELNPVWKIGISLIENKRFGGGQIYKPFDDLKDQVKDLTPWLAAETVGMLKPLAKKDDSRSKLLKEAIKNSPYPIMLNMLKFYSFQYGGDVAIMRRIKAAQRLTNEFQRNERSYMIEDPTSLGNFENRIKNYQKRLLQILEPINEKKAGPSILNPKGENSGTTQP